METSQQNNKRIAKNTLMLYFRMILTMLVSLYTSRVVLNTLGVEDYGTYMVVGGVVAMFGFFNSAMSASVQRFFAYEIGRKNFDQLNKTFNTALIVHFFITLIVFILGETLGLWIVNTYLNIPPERMEAARWVYQFSIFTFMISVIQVPFNALLISHERMNVYAYLSILEVSLKLLIVFILTWLSFDKLKLYGILVFAVSLLMALIYQQYTKYHFKESKFQIVKDKVLYKKMISFSSWSLLGNGAMVGSNQGVSIILNIFLGVTVNAAVGIANQVNTAVYGFISNFQTAFNPQIIKSFAALEINGHSNIVYKSSKYSYFLLLILILPIIFNTEYILELWLKITPQYAVPFTQIILINSLIDALAGPFWMSLNAVGKIKKYQIIISTLLLLNIPFTFLLLKYGFSPVYVLITKNLITVFIFIVRIVFFKNNLQIVLSQIFHRLLKPIIIVSFFCSILLVIFKLILFTNDTFINFIAFTITSSVCNILIIFYLGFEFNEKMIISEKVNSFIRKHF